jgi:hypothetical protein
MEFVALHSEVLTMRDNRDRELISEEPYEIEYIHRQFPNRSHEEVHRAIESAKAQLHGSEDRKKIMQLVRKSLA